MLHESPAVMTVPLVILAVFAVFLGWIGSDLLSNPFEHLIRFEQAPPPSENLMLIVIAVGVAIAGWLAAGAVYLWQIVPSEALKRTFRPVYTLLVRKYYVDDLYGWVFLGIGGLVVRLAGAFDRYVVDGLVNLVGWIARQLGLGLRYVQTGREETYLLLVFLGVVIIVLVRLAW